LRRHFLNSYQRESLDDGFKGLPAIQNQALEATIILLSAGMRWTTSA
jgi:hypothetical protein